MATASVDHRRKCGSLLTGRSAACSRRMEDTIGRTFLRYQQQPLGGQCLCRDCVGKAKHFTIRVHKMLEVQSLYKPTPPHQPTAKRRRLRLTSVPLVDLRAPPGDGGGHYHDIYESLNSPPRSLISDADAASLSTRSGICSMSDSMDSQRLGSSSIRIKHLTSTWETESRFPKLNECAHFHYDFVELGPIEVCLFDETQENCKLLANGEPEHSENFAVQVSSNGKSWVVRRSYENFHMLDRQLHQCIYDRKFSSLNKIPRDRAVQQAEDNATHNASASLKEIYGGLFAEYLLRLSDIAGNLINCGPILNWLELDNRGNRLIVTDDSAINTPAVAAAYVTKRYTAQASDEISFEVGDMISVIDMPPSDESIWWRGKRGFEVGFFPSECVEVIGDKLPHTIHIPKAPTKPVLRKHGKLIAFFRSFILSRPSRRKLKQSGILKERVFGCDLGEHLLNSGHDIPTVLTSCTEFIESHGIVDGIYRLSGVTSNIQKLRNTFDEDRVPDLNDEAILQDIHCVASLLKMYFRELPNPLLTYQLYDKFVSAVQSDDDVKLLSVRDVVQQLPPPHYRTLEFLVKHLSRVAAFGAETGMTPKNVAIVWAPNLLRSKDLEVGGVAALQVVGVQAVVTEYLIHYSDLIFNDKMPVFPPCPGSGGTPRRSRPKSLAISTPTKLLSLEEARSRALGTGTQYSQKYIEVGGGPSTLPNKYHTVIDLPDRKRGSTKNKKSPSGWKSFFSKGKSSSQSTRERDKKTRRKGSTTPSDPGTSFGLADKAVTESDSSRNNNRLRSVKSAESLVSSTATNSNRNSNVTDSGNIIIPGRNGRHGARLSECCATSEDELSQSLSSARAPESLAGVPLRLSPHSHVRSVSHDSYFEFTLDRRRGADDQRPPAELSTILSEDNDDEDSCSFTNLSAADLRYSAKLHHATRDATADFHILGRMETEGDSSATYDPATDDPTSTTNTTAAATRGLSTASDSRRRPPSDIRLDVTTASTSSGAAGGPLDTLASESLSLDFEDGPCDIVGDIQKEVADLLWNRAEMDSLTGFRIADSKMAWNTDAGDGAADLDDASGDETSDRHETNVNLSPTSTGNGKVVVVERYGSAKTVIVEVHATEDSSAEEELVSDPGYHPLVNQEDDCSSVALAGSAGVWNRDSCNGASAAPATAYSMMMSDVSGLIPYADSALPTPIDVSSSLADECPFLFDSLEGGQPPVTQQQQQQQRVSLVSSCGVMDDSSGINALSHDDSFLLDSLEPARPLEACFERVTSRSPVSSEVRGQINTGQPSLMVELQHAAEQAATLELADVDHLDSLDGSQQVGDKCPAVTDDASADQLENILHPHGHHPRSEIAVTPTTGAPVVDSPHESLDSSPSGSSRVTSREMSPQGLLLDGGARPASDLFGYCVLVNEEEAVTPGLVPDAANHELDFSLRTNRIESPTSKNNSESVGPPLPEESFGLSLDSHHDNLVEIISDDSMRETAQSETVVATHSPFEAQPDVASELTSVAVTRQNVFDSIHGFLFADEPISVDPFADPNSPAAQSPVPKSSATTPCEKLSPMEESKRKFESEIGRDIMRERKVKLELEKIQLEQTSHHHHHHQQLQKTSPRSDTSFDDMQFFGESPATTPRTPPVTTTQLAFGSPQPEAETKPELDSSFGPVELRRPKSCATESAATVAAGGQPAGTTDPFKRCSEPLPSPTTFQLAGIIAPVQDDATDGHQTICSDAKRNSEPPSFQAKSSRPERKASVRELMSKFEKKPKVVCGGGSEESSGAELTAPTATSPTAKRPPLPRSSKLTATSPVATAAPSLLSSDRCSRNNEMSSSSVSDHSTTSIVSEAEVTYERLLDADIDSRMSVSLPDSFLLSANAEEHHRDDKLSGGASQTGDSDVASPTDQQQHHRHLQEWNSLSDAAECFGGSVPSDIARRERIDRYKEERRAQLRNCIRPESFRGERTGDSGQYSRLKTKTATSPTNFDFAEAASLGGGGGSSGSPRRRARLSALSLGSPSDGGEDRLETFVSRRRSFNVRSATVSGTGGFVAVSPTESAEERTCLVTPPVSPLKAAGKERGTTTTGCGLPIPPSSPRKTAAVIVEISTNKPKCLESGWQRRSSTASSPKDDQPSSGVDVMTRSLDATALRLSLPPGGVAASVEKENVAGTRRPSSLNTKAGPTPVLKSGKLKSPVSREAKTVFPPSGAPAVSRESVASSRDERREIDSRNKPSPMPESSAGGARAELARSGGSSADVFPAPTSRKIKEVAAMFEHAQPNPVPHVRKSNVVHGHVTGRFPAPPAVSE